MYPVLLRIGGGIAIHSYGLCLAVGFGLATWWAVGRARRAEASPAVVLNIAILAVVFGVGGARLLYVVHYWEHFAARQNLLRAVLDVRQGGLEFLGGFVCTVVVVLIYLLIPRRQSSKHGRRVGLPVRLYLDILSPSVMVGLTFARLGCFLNGCCFGGACALTENGAPKYSWAVRFPFGSPVFVHQWEEREVTVPAELLEESESRLPGRPISRVALSQPDGEIARRALAGQLRLPSRSAPIRKTSVAELQSLAAAVTTRPTHPVQLYAAFCAILLAGVLAYVYRVRRRHGMVFIALLLLYSPVRFVLERIRTDNPLDTAGLTVSQFTSSALFVVGVGLLFIFYRYLPEESPNLVSVSSSHAAGRTARPKRAGR